jgi:glucose/arabinose dehydrogenase
MRLPAALRIVPVTVAVLVLLDAWQAGMTPVSADPAADTYSVQAMVPDAYLGANGAAVIEFAMIPGRPNEAIVARQSGHIYRVALDGNFAPQLWGNVSNKVTFSGEQGLLSVAFAPDFLTSGRVYLYYTPGSPTPTVLARYLATATDLNEASEEILLNIEEFAGNHNGGHIVFDSAGLLYLGLGDGGGSGDPNEKGQALNTLLGKIIRLDVSGPTGYAIPADHPFDDGGGPIREEVFAYGFRNPFRMTIDPLTDDLWVGDVGQDDWEEVDKVVMGGNYGWDCYEGKHPFESTGCTGTYLEPRAEYSHSFGQAVTGGGVYRGADLPELYGWYVYGDFYTGHIWAVNPADSSDPIHLDQVPLNISSFTLLADGELAVVSYDEGVYRLAAEDADGDSVAAINDNCPEWPNGNQVLPAWPIDNDDADCDGYSRNREESMGTAEGTHCAATGASNDEAGSDAWAPDFDDNRLATITDVSKFSSVFGSVAPGPPYAARYDFNASGSITITDVSQYSVYFGKSCAP